MQATDAVAALNNQASQELISNAERASAFLKTLANPHRLIVLCLLANGEKNVSELEARLGIRQPTLSQQLARLREEGIVTTRRQGKEVWYSLHSAEAIAIIRTVHEVFCNQSPSCD